MSGFSQQVFLRFSHAVACTKTSIHFTTKPFADRGYLTFYLPVNWLTLGHLDLTEAMGIHIQVSAWTHSFISFGGREGAKLPGNLVPLCLSLLRASRWPSKVTGPPSPLPLVPHEGSGFSIPSATLAAIPVSLESHILMGWEVAHCGFICSSLVAADTEHPFMCPLLCRPLRLCDISFAHFLL